MGRWETTHETLSRAALELFASRGYDATTTAQVAARAGVSEMTLFRHFPSKEALLLQDPFDPLMAEAVRAVPAPVPALRAVVEGLRQVWGHIDEDQLQELRARLRVIAGSEALRGAVERHSAATTDALDEALVAGGRTPLAARVAATSAIAGLGAALLEWAQNEQSSLDEVMHSAFATLAGER